MGLFDRFVKKEEKNIHTDCNKIYAPITGRYIPLEEIPDEVFSQGILGRGCGIVPEKERVVSPADGVISAVAETKHAIGLSAGSGAEMLIHVGMDTVSMEGKGFSVKVSEGDRVKCGEILMEFDMDAMNQAGCSPVTAFLVTNSDDFPEVCVNTGNYREKEEIGKIR